MDRVHVIALMAAQIHAARIMTGTHLVESDSEQASDGHHIVTCTNCAVEATNLHRAVVSATDTPNAGGE